MQAAVKCSDMVREIVGVEWSWIPLSVMMLLLAEQLFNVRGRVSFFRSVAEKYRGLANKRISKKFKAD